MYIFEQFVYNSIFNVHNYLIISQHFISMFMIPFLFRFDDEEDSSRTPTNELTPEEDQETTYSGYPGPEPPYQEYPGPGTPEPYPGVYPGGVPHIPEPDYDISDLENCENGSYSGSDSSWRQDQEQFRDTATLRSPPPPIPVWSLLIFFCCTHFVLCTDYTDCLSPFTGWAT